MGKVFSHCDKIFLCNLLKLMCEGVYKKSTAPKRSPRGEAPGRGGIVFMNTWTVFSDDFRVCHFLLWVMRLVKFEKRHHIKLEVIRCFHAKKC